MMGQAGANVATIFDCIDADEGRAALPNKDN
jgi:hypothetical protein